MTSCGSKLQWSALIRCIAEPVGQGIIDGTSIPALGSGGGEGQAGEGVAKDELDEDI